MARKNAKKKRSSRRQTFSIIGTAKTLAVANILTQGAANTNVIGFITGKTDAVGLSPRYGMGGTAYNPNHNDAVITLPELIGIDRKKQQIGSQSFGAMVHEANPMASFAQMQANIRDNAVSMATSTVVTMVGFKVADRLLGRTGIKRSVNKTMKFIGLNEVRA